MSQTINEALVSRIKELLAKKNMKQFHLEQNSGIGHGLMSHIMSGRNKTVEFTTIMLISKGFSMSATEFINDPLFDFKNIEIVKRQKVAKTQSQ